MPVQSRLSLLLLLCVAAGCPKRTPVQQKPTIPPSTLFLEPVPTAVASIRYAGPDHQYVGPARFEDSRADGKWTLLIEDFDNGNPIEVCIATESPLTFCQAPEAMKDKGKLVHDGDTARLELSRTGYDDQQRSLTAQINLDPDPVLRPRDWIQTGTTLYFGRAFDDKPVTKVVPMALTVRVGEATDGGRVLSWKADIDVRDQVDVTGERTMAGRRLVSGAVVAAGTQHSDAFARGEDVSAETTSIFVSRKALEDTKRYGGAPFHDLELDESGVLVVTGETEVVVRADGGLWRIPAVVATVGGGEAVYVIADDPEHPLILSATRPGYKVRLMAISSPDAPQ